MRKPRNVPDHEDEDTLMKDVEEPTRCDAPPHLPKKPESRSSQPNEMKKGGTSDVPQSIKTPGRQSELTSKIPLTSVVDKVLSVPVTLHLGDLLAASKEVAGSITDLIRPKNAKVTAVAMSRNDPLVASSFVAKNRGHLIKLNLDIEGTRLTGIIDTGSQLNVVRQEIVDEVIRKPIDPTKIVRMHDANGGEGFLHGLVPEVEMACGQVRTIANLYVGRKVPFDLLLGRPWQRGNLVSNEEREQGTYLTFPNPEDPHDSSKRLPLLVIPANPSTSDMNFLRSLEDTATIEEIDTETEAEVHLMQDGSQDQETKTPETSNDDERLVDNEGESKARSAECRVMSHAISARSD